MGFNNRYTSYSGKGKGSLKLKADNTILKFWGFEYKSNTNTSTSTYDDGYTASWTDDNHVQIKKNTRTSSLTSYSSEYYRSYHPTLKEKNLEDRFYHLIKEKYSEKGEFKIEKTPYLYTSARELYSSSRTTIAWSGAGIFGILAALAVLVAVIWLWISMISAAGVGFIVAILMLAGLLLPFVLVGGIAVYIAGGLFFGMLWLLLHLFIPPYNLLSRKRKEELRRKYFNSLSVGIYEADQILCEYAILRGYDKI